MTTEPVVVPPRENERTNSSPDDLSLDLSAAEYLEKIPWAGVAPDPDELDAATFLSWL